MENSADVNIMEQLDCLLESLSNQEIKDRISNCSRQVVALAQTLTYLQYCFGVVLESNLKVNLLNENYTKDSFRPFFTNLESLIITELDAARDQLAVKKNETKKMTCSYSKLARLMEKPIDNLIKPLNQQIDAMIVTIPDVEFRIESFEQSIDAAKKLSLQLKDSIGVVEKKMKNLISASMPQDFVEKITQPEGIALNKLDFKTLKDLYGTNLKDILRITLTES